MVNLKEISPNLYGKDVSVEGAYDICKGIGTEHYENFTVVSRAMPAEKRKYVYALYAFSRYTDDLGDELEEGNLEALDTWEEELREASRERSRITRYCSPFRIRWISIP